MKSLSLIAAALAAALIAAGCGNDDESTGTGTEAEELTKAEFIVAGNDICTQGTVELDAAAQGTFGNQQPTPAEEDAFVTDTVVPSLQGQIDDVRALVPEDEADEVDAILDDAQSALDELEADPSSISQEDPFASVNDDLRAYGLSACAG